MWRVRSGQAILFCVSRAVGRSELLLSGAYRSGHRDYARATDVLWQPLVPGEAADLGGSCCIPG